MFHCITTCKHQDVIGKAQLEETAPLRTGLDTNALALSSRACLLPLQVQVPHAFLNDSNEEKSAYGITLFDSPFDTEF